MSVRLATAEDLNEMARIHAACFARAWTEQALCDLLKTPGIIALVASNGFVIGRVAADESEILTLAVEPAARRAGQGAALLAEAARHAYELGAATMFLEVAGANDAARALYARSGFAAVGKRKSYYDATEDALILKRDLPLAPLGNLSGSARVSTQPLGNDRDAD